MMRCQKGKPSPEPFSHSSPKLGADPSRCVVFEDSPSGGPAGLAASATVIAVGDQPWPVEPSTGMADHSEVEVAWQRLEVEALLKG